jgi:hypothetical protein
MTYATELRTALETALAERNALDEEITAVYDKAHKTNTPAPDMSLNFSALRALEANIRKLEQELKAEEAEQGTPATYAVGTDRYAGRVAKVARFKSGKNEGKVSVITFQFADTTGGLSGRLNDFRQNNRGYWKAVNSSATLHIGYAEDYRDPHF